MTRTIGFPDHVVVLRKITVASLAKPNGHLTPAFLAQKEREMNKKLDSITIRLGERGLAVDMHWTSEEDILFLDEASSYFSTTEEALDYLNTILAEEADELNDLTPHEGEEEDEDIPPMPEGEGWVRNTGEQPFSGGLWVEICCRNGALYTDDVAVFDWSQEYGYDCGIIWYRKAQQEAIQAARLVEQEAEPAPPPEGFIPWTGGSDPLREMDIDRKFFRKFSAGGAKVWFGFDALSPEFDWDIRWSKEMWGQKARNKANYITALKLPEGYELVDAEGGKVIRKIDHFAEAAAQIEASIDEREEAAASAYEVGQRVSFECDDIEVTGEISHVGQDYSSHEPWYNIKASDSEIYFQVDHQFVTPIEAQAETESTEPEAEIPEWALLTEEEKAEGWIQYDFDGIEPPNVAEILFVDRKVYTAREFEGGWEYYSCKKQSRPDTIIGYRLKPDTAEAMQAIAQAAEAVEVAPPPVVVIDDVEGTMTRNGVEEDPLTETRAALDALKWAEG